MTKISTQNRFVDWLNDESVFAYSVANEILFFERSNPGIPAEIFFLSKKNIGLFLFLFTIETPANRYKIDNLQAFNLNPISKCIAVHASGKKVNKNAYIYYVGN
jgi:hypothetical protein